jgi:micrococcal nuclease
MERDRRRSDTKQARGRLAALSALAVAVTALALMAGGWLLQQAATMPAPGAGGAGARPAESTAPAPVAAIHVRTPGGVDETIRFIGVNTPESTTKHEPYGNEASAYTKSKLPVGLTVWLELDTDERDRYGRLLAYVWMERPSSRSPAEVRDKMFNAELLLEGYAQLMTIPPDVRYVDVFTPMQSEAREASRGLWGLPAQ